MFKLSRQRRPALWVLTIAAALAGCNRRDIPASPPITVQVQHISPEAVLCGNAFQRHRQGRTSD